MRKIISLKIDLTNIDKDRIYHSEKTGAKYLDAVLLFDTENDKYDNNGVIIQSVSKEEREAGTKGNILGNAKDLTRNEPVPSCETKIEDNDLPF